MLRLCRLDESPLRMQHFCIRLLRYLYDIVYVPRKTQLTTDALSHAPIVSVQAVNNIEHESAVEEYSISSVRMVLQSSKWDTDIFSKIHEEQKRI